MPSKADWLGVDALTATLAGVVRVRLLSDRDVPEGRTRLVIEQTANQRARNASFDMVCGHV